MKKVYGVVGIAAVLTLTACQAEEAPEPTPKPTAIEAEEEETLFVIGSIQIGSDDATLFDDGKCAPHAGLAGKYVSELETEQVVVKDAADKVVATSEFHTDHNEGSCAWLFDVEIVPESDFYKAEFLGLETPIASVSDANGRVLTLDFISPINEQAQEDADEAWPMPLPGSN